jgi:glycerophosphoryl diester phosphodiesterase
VTSRFEFLDWPHPIPFAHQGGAAERPENTMTAFQHAVDLGYRYLETDVQVTADGVLAVFHDPTLDRATDRKGVISELPWSIVSQARVAGVEPIPRFEDILSSFPAARINVEPKTEPGVQPLIDAIRTAGAIGRVCVGSFADARVRRMRSALGPELCTSLGTGEITRVRLGSWLPGGLGRWVGLNGGACAQVPAKRGPIPVVDEAFVSTAHELRLAVHVWTINDANEMRRLLDLGVDGIMTDAPSVLKDVLVQRGQWA